MGKIVGLTFEVKEKTALYPCLICGKEYKSEKGLSDHMAKEHPKPQEPPQEPPKV